ncbi:hypothetical protein FF011L_01240 [Roseimaritima multifibrata]|uniref:Uncharacterized protein n=1 Tax=Roseimaritima multifibrata TaxID=1930274 RepID=A0A517M928_9BACT|nr:hypothetical protein FF011L_01240 [Roseimaritima multifibrata]
MAKPSGRKKFSITNSVARWAKQCTGSNPAAEAAGKYLPPSGLKRASPYTGRRPDGLRRAARMDNDRVTLALRLRAVESADRLTFLDVVWARTVARS